MGLNKKDLVEMYEDYSKQFNPEFAKATLKATGRGDVCAARDYIAAICIMATCIKYNAPLKELHTLSDIKAHLPAAVRFRLAAYSPCLAYRYDELKEPAQKELFDNRNWLATEKENGVRGWVIVSRGRAYLFSRNYSDVDCTVPEYWSNIYQELSFDPEDTFAVDVEVKFEPDYDLVKTMEDFGVATNSKLEAMSALLQTYPETAQKIQKEYKVKTGKDLIVFRVIHPLFYKGKNYIKSGVKLLEGKKVLKEVIEYGQKHGLNLKPIAHCIGTREQKEQFLDTILESGGEGIVFHNLQSCYNTSENRDRSVFVKLKRSVSGAKASAGMGDTIEGWISGFKMANESAGNKGLIGSFEVSCYIQDSKGSLREHVIAFVPNIPQKMREQCTVTDSEGNPTLREDFYDMVVELEGQEISAVNRRLTHPRLIRFRTDKSKQDCVFSEEFMVSQMSTTHSM